MSPEEKIYKYSQNVIKWPKNRKKGGVTTVTTVTTGFLEKIMKKYWSLAWFHLVTGDTLDTLRVCYLVVLTVMTL